MCIAMALRTKEWDYILSEALLSPPLSNTERISHDKGSLIASRVHDEQL